MRNVPALLLDGSFMAAVADRGDTRHAEAASIHLGLLDRFERHEIRLRARVDHLALVGDDLRRTLFAPVETIHLATQHRSAAERMARTDERIDPDVALTLVVMRREHIATVATFDRRFEAFDVDVISSAPPLALSPSAFPLAPPPAPGATGDERSAADSGLELGS